MLVTGVKIGEVTGMEKIYRGYRRRRSLLKLIAQEGMK
jgi:hypothetical protein